MSHCQSQNKKKEIIQCTFIFDNNDNIQSPSHSLESIAIIITLIVVIIHHSNVYITLTFIIQNIIWLAAMMDVVCI